MPTRRTATLVIVLAILLSIISTIQIKLSSTSDIIVVPDDYPTIQEAINAASNGDTVFVKAGTYYENVVVNRVVSLIGENIHSTIVEGNRTGTVLKITQNNVNVTGLTIRGSGSTPNVDAGICLENVGYCAISGNRVMENEFGISLTGSYRNAISENLAMENYGWGIHLEYSSNHNTLVENFISENRGGIDIHFSSHFNTIVQNRIANGTYGMILNNADSNSISQNFMSHLELGICLQAEADYNIVFENNITDCGDGTELRQARNNSFYHNTFNNSQQVVISTGGYTNFWDDGYPSGGNYWSDYTGVDLDLDGIGDTPHVINGNNIDNYPLMGMFSDFNATSDYHVQTICNSTLSDFQFNNTAITFNVSGEAGTLGFCRICIPTVLMNETYKVFVNGTEILPVPLPLPCSNSTHNYLYFNYTHSTQQVVIIPEFPSFLILPLFMIATLLAVIVYKREHQTRNKKRKFCFVVSFYV